MTYERPLKLPIISGLKTLASGRLRAAPILLGEVSKEYPDDNHATHPHQQEVVTKVLLQIKQFVDPHETMAFTEAEKVAARALCNAHYGPIRQALMDAIYHEDDPMLFLRTKRGERIREIIYQLEPR